MTLRRFTSDEVYSIGNTGASKEINWNNGIQQRAVLTASTAFTFVNPGKRGNIFTLELLVDATGAYTPTWAGCDWGDAGEPSYAANENYLINLYYDGTTYQMSYRAT